MATPEPGEGSRAGAREGTATTRTITQGRARGVHPLRDLRSRRGDMSDLRDRVPLLSGDRRPHHPVGPGRVGHPRERTTSSSNVQPAERPSRHALDVGSLTTNCCWAGLSGFQAEPSWVERVSQSTAEIACLRMGCTFGRVEVLPEPNRVVAAAPLTGMSAFDGLQFPAVHAAEYAVGVLADLIVGQLNVVVKLSAEHSIVDMDKRHLAPSPLR